jgi:hypothetical protein
MDAPVILASAAPQAVWFPERIEVASFARQAGGSAHGAVKKAMLGGAVAGAAVGGFVGAAVGGIAAGVASSAATPGTHVEYTLAVTIQGIQMQRQTRWSAAEALVAKMKEHALPEVKAVAEQLPVKFFTLADVGSPEVDARIQKRAAQLGSFMAALCDCWRQICWQHGPTSPHGKLFADFFELPGTSQAPFAAQPEVGAEFGDWRVSGGMLLAMAVPVQADATPAAPAPAPAPGPPPAFAPAAVGAASSPAPPGVAAAPAPLQTVQMQCPDGAGPGVTVSFQHNGQLLHVTIPHGVSPGGTFEIQLAPPVAVRHTPPSRQPVGMFVGMS